MPIKDMTNNMASQRPSRRAAQKAVMRMQTYDEVGHKEGQMEVYLNLPDELLLQIFGNLDGKDLVTCSHVCRRFRKILLGQRLWDKTVLDEGFSIWRADWGRCQTCMGRHMNGLSEDNQEELCTSQYKGDPPTNGIQEYLRFCRFTEAVENGRFVQTKDHMYDGTEQPRRFMNLPLRHCNLRLVWQDGEDGSMRLYPRYQSGNSVVIDMPLTHDSADRWQGHTFGSGLLLINDMKHRIAAVAWPKKLRDMSQKDVMSFMSEVKPKDWFVSDFVHSGTCKVVVNLDTRDSLHAQDVEVFALVDPAELRLTFFRMNMKEQWILPTTFLQLPSDWGPDGELSVQVTFNHTLILVSGTHTSVHFWKDYGKEIVDKSYDFSWCSYARLLPSYAAYPNVHGQINGPECRERGIVVEAMPPGAAGREGADTRMIITLLPHDEQPQVLTCSGCELGMPLSSDPNAARIQCWNGNYFVFLGAENTENWITEVTIGQLARVKKTRGLDGGFHHLFRVVKNTKFRLKKRGVRLSDVHWEDTTLHFAFCDEYHTQYLSYNFIGRRSHKFIDAVKLVLEMPENRGKLLRCEEIMAEIRKHGVFIPSNAPTPSQTLNRVLHQHCKGDDPLLELVDDQLVHLFRLRGTGPESKRKAKEDHAKSKRRAK
eukprot:Clim_evm3s166 gene=Clim_evmTU3s166